MVTLFISLLTLVLLLVSAFLVLLVLMQRTSQSGGMGAALGGGAAESAFGAETSNILTKGTIYGIIAFFVVALGLYLLYQSQLGEAGEVKDPEVLLNADAGEGATTATEVLGGDAAEGAAPMPEDASAGDGTNGAAAGSMETMSEGVDAPTDAATDTSTESDEAVAEEPAPSAP